MMPVRDWRRWLASRGPQSARYRYHKLRQHIRLLRDNGLAYYCRRTYLKHRLWLADRQQTQYQELSRSDLVNRRRSDTVFIFGSGYSLNDLSSSEWAHIRRHDVFGFGAFIHQRWIPVDFHLFRNWDESHEGVNRLAVSARQCAADFGRNPLFRKAVLIMQREHNAMFCNYLTSHRLLPPGSLLFRYRTARSVDELPSEDIREGVSHTVGTLADCVNVAYLLGWTSIALVGVDLYDSRYFWGPADGTTNIDESGREVPAELTDRGVDWQAPHSTARHGIVKIMGSWAGVLGEKGVRLSVYNPRSLLREVLPLYRPVESGRADSRDACGGGEV